MLIAARLDCYNYYRIILLYGSLYLLGYFHVGFL